MTESTSSHCQFLQTTKITELYHPLSIKPGTQWNATIYTGNMTDTFHIHYD